jgi:hypothetical protein
LPPSHHVPIEEANQWLALMIAQGYHAPVDDLSLLLDEQG